MFLNSNVGLNVQQDLFFLFLPAMFQVRVVELHSTCITVDKHTYQYMHTMLSTYSGSKLRKMHGV